MVMRIHLNGELLASTRVSQPARTADNTVGNQLCYFGNTRENAPTNSSGQVATLNADVAYLLISDVARQLNDIRQQVFRKYPNPDTQRSIFYFKLDEQDNYLVDYHFNRTV